MVDVVTSSFGFHFEGVTEFIEALSAAQAKAEIAAKLAVTKSANVVKRNTQTALALRSHRKGTWSPSPPGDAPALVSGALRRSINVQVRGSVTAEYTAEIGPTIIYGRIQELGGDTGRGHSVHLPPRPYLRPALEFSIPEITGVYVSAWADVFGLGGLI